MDVFETLTARGFLQQCTHPDEVGDALAAEPLTFYVGFDPTAHSLHAGSLLQIMLISWLQRLGHRAVVVVGGGTAMVGDPSGRTELRQMLSSVQIDAHIASFKSQLSHFITFDEQTGWLVDNREWLLKLGYIDFLRDIGSQFSVNRMLSAEAYKSRLASDSGLSFIEFNYQLLQSYDFLRLYRSHGCRLQIGGNDQWGNIVAGVDLIRRLEQGQAWGLTTPLLTTASGVKMGKTAAGAVWLDPELLKPFDYWQFWYNVDDRDVGRFLRLYTFLPLDEIARLEALPGAQIRDAKRVLANEATTLLHGAEAAAAADAGAKAMAGGEASADQPTHAVSESGKLVAVLADAGMAKSRGEARRLIAQGGVRIDGEVTTDIDKVIDPLALGSDGVVVRVGKKRVVRLMAG